MEKKITTIKLTQETKMELAKLGAKGDSFEAIVKYLLEHYRRTKDKRKES